MSEILNGQVDSWIDKHSEEFVEFILEFSKIDSPPGHEKEAVDFLYSWLSEQGFAPKKQVVTENRSNVITTVDGTEEGGSDLLFNGHIDTAYGNPEIDRWTVGDIEEIRTNAWREDEYLFGDDVVNDKGPTSAFIWAAKALKECGVELKGDLILTGVVGEISSAPVEQYTDTKYRGAGIGTQTLIESGISPDYALVAEMTDYAIAQMECGVVWFKITINDSPTYQPTVPDIESDEPSMMEKISIAIDLLDEWETDYRNQNTVEYSHGINRPSAGIGAIRTGHPVQPSSNPGTATLYFDVRLPPGQKPTFVKDDLAELLKQELPSVNIEPYLFKMGHIADQEEVSPLVSGIESAHKRIKGSRTPFPKPHNTSMWRDSNIFNEYGIPSVNFGPGRPSGSEHYIDRSGFSVKIEELINTAKIFATTAVELCGATGPDQSA